MNLKKGFVYQLENFTAPKYFNGLNFECLFTDQLISHRAKVVKEISSFAAFNKSEVWKPERFNSKTLHLNLKKKWFDMILSGQKKEEYRDISDYWIKRIKCHSLTEPKAFQHFDTITFSNGYSKNRPQFEIELKNIKIDYGRMNWGAIPDTQYFVLELGEIISYNQFINRFGMGRLVSS